MFRPIASIIQLEMPTASVVFPAYSQPITIRFTGVSINDSYDPGRVGPGRLPSEADHITAPRLRPRGLL